MKRNVLFEDAVNYYNRWVRGIASRDLATQNIKLKEILNKDTEFADQHPNLSQADQQLPYPMDNSIAVLGNLAINVSNALTLYREALKNPALKENKKIKGEVILTIKALKRIQCIFGLLFDRLTPKN